MKKISLYVPIVDNEDYFIDMLFYHTRLHCYIVIELKNTKFKPEYAGKSKLLFVSC